MQLMTLEIMKRNTKINKDNEAKMHWHLDDQVALSQSKVYRRTIESRINFIVKAISDHKNTQKRSPVPLRVLDAGCGDGVVLKSLSTIDGCLAVGCDFNKIRLLRSKSNCLSALHVNAELVNIPFRKRSFHVVVLNQVLEHIGDDGEALRRINHLLEANGILILGVPNEGSFLGYLRNNLIQRKIRKDTDHKHFYAESRIREKILRNGFDILAVRRDGFMFPHIWINDFMVSFDLGFNFAQLLGKIFKSQCAGLYFVCKKIKES